MGLIMLLFGLYAFGQQPGSISGLVQDASGSVVPGASITVVSVKGVAKTTTANKMGQFSVGGIAAGKYIVKAIASGFSLYENREVEVTSGQKTELTIPLTIAAVEENVDVSLNAAVSTDADAADVSVADRSSRK